MMDPKEYVKTMDIFSRPQPVTANAYRTRHEQALEDYRRRLDTEAKHQIAVARLRKLG